VDDLGNMNASRPRAARAGRDHIGAPGVPDARHTTPETAADRIPWRWAGSGVASAGLPAAVGVLHPALGVIVAFVALSAVLTVFGTAMFGSPELSRRAFRLMCWIGNRPEPRSRGGDLTGGSGAQDSDIPPASAP
jgi:hypothetical protein